MKFFVKSFGCRTNHAEIQGWILKLENSGYQLTKSINNAGFGIINTCSLTEKAENKILSYIRKHNIKQQNIPCVITGCTVSKEKSSLEREFNDYLFVSNDQKGEIIELIKKRFTISSNLIYNSSYKSRYFLKIQDGCNFKCSYCIIPSLRGKSRSIPVNQLLEEAEKSSDMGYQEIVLTGINLSSYGYDFFPRQTLIDLVGGIDKIKQLKMIRLSSLDPRIINFTFIKKLSKIKKLARSFHISFQNGANNILREMKRGSKQEDFIKIMEDFKGFFPDANFGTDIILGFPGETEKNFEETFDFVKRSGLNYLHIFPFSPREGTKAASLPTVSNHIVQRRMVKLRELNKQIKNDFKEKSRDTIQKAIVVEESSEYSYAITSNFLKVRFDKVPGLKKRFVNVKIRTILDENLCEGQLLVK